MTFTELRPVAPSQSNFAVKQRFTAAEMICLTNHSITKNLSLCTNGSEWAYIAK